MQDHIQPRVWLKAFWGFEPQNEGYLGFTRPGDRDRFIENYEARDLVLIYGADATETAAQDRRQVLGFLEVEPTPIKDVERLSDIGRNQKIDNGWADRWTHAVPAKRAWRINRRIEVRHIAPDTYRPRMARLIASRGELMTDKEAENALALPVTQVNVFGEETVEQETTGEYKLHDVFRPSHGISPSFGAREYEFDDGEHYLYMMRFDGHVEALLGRESFEVLKKEVVKIGYSKDPKQRCVDLNSGFPPAAIYRWELSVTSRPFPNGQSAKEAEDHLKKIFDDQFESLGGEFFLGEDRKLDSAFSQASAPTAFHIKATSSKK